MHQKQIMRKITQTLLLMLLLAISSNVKGESIVDETISVQLRYNDPHDESHPVTRIPPAPISVTQSDHVFTFTEYLSGETIEIMSGGAVVYTSVIGEDGTVVIPDHIEGVLELVLYLGDKKYSAEVEL